MDFADEDAKARREYLSEEIQRVLAEVLPEQRDAFLKALMEQFPTWDQAVQLDLRSKDAVDRGATDSRESRDPGFLIARLAEVASNLDAKDKRVLQEEVALAGLAPPTAGGPDLPAEPLQRLKAKLQLGEKSPLDAGRLLDLAATVAELAGSLDQLVWIAWREMAPNSAIKHGADLRRLMSRFVSGDADISRTQAAEEVEKLRKLVASLISAVKMTGRQFASQYLARFAPTEIQALVSMEGGGFMVSKDVKCWRKYVELAETMDQASIENDITNSIVSSAESLMKGLGR